VTPSSRRILFLQTSMDHGGATAVAAWMIEALKDDYEITLLSATPVDWASVNQLFGTLISENELVMKTTIAPLRYLLRLDPDPGSIQPVAYLMRVCRRIRHKFDLVICAATEEADLSGDGILYVHYPSLARHWTSLKDWGNRPLMQQLSFLVRGKIRPWVFLSRYSVERMKRCRILTNSDWTGARIRECYGVSSETVYPPVTPAPDTLPWHLRENSFAVVGRLNHFKRFDWIIDLFDSVRQRHSDLRLYLVGTRDTGPEADACYSSLVRQARVRSTWLTLHEGLSRTELLRLLGRVKYAIHAKEDEHFGIAPAEALLAGCIPLVHDSGGQVEIVGHDSRLCFSDREDAIQKIDRILSDVELQRSVQQFLASRRGLFSAERFKTEIRRIVRDALSGKV
jgi:glycosyltransferase involved in cell wall biosynthesis